MVAVATGPGSGTASTAADSAVPLPAPERPTTPTNRFNDPYEPTSDGRTTTGGTTATTRASVTPSSAQGATLRARANACK